MEYTETNLHNIMSFQFYGNVYMGTPHQKLEMMFDTGSSQAWTYSDGSCREGTFNKCPDTFGDKFDEKRSEAFKMIGDEVI